MACGPSRPAQGRGGLSTAVVKGRERLRTSFWCSFEQKKRSTPALAQDEQRFEVLTSQTSQGWAAVVSGIVIGPFAEDQAAAEQRRARASEGWEREERALEPSLCPPLDPLPLKRAASTGSARIRRLIRSAVLARAPSSPLDPPRCGSSAPTRILLPCRLEPEALDKFPLVRAITSSAIIAATCNLGIRGTDSPGS